MIYSTGHGRYKTAADIRKEIEQYGITVLIDLRTRPYSRWQPVFNRTVLPGLIKPTEYLWLGDTLGGLGPPIQDDALANLVQFSKHRKVLIMCSETDPLKCHRHTVIAKRLVAMDTRVYHLTNSGVKTGEQLGFADDDPKQGTLF